MKLSPAMRKALQALAEHGPILYHMSVLAGGYVVRPRASFGVRIASLNGLASRGLATQEHSYAIGGGDFTFTIAPAGRALLEEEEG